MTATDRPGPPLWLLAELTYRCPLKCSWCNNPLDFDDYAARELSTDEWKRVLRESRELGALQLGFTGGEPLQRPDLEELVAYANDLGFYTNLITSGIGLTEARLVALKAAGHEAAGVPTLHMELDGVLDPEAAARLELRQYYETVHPQGREVPLG